MTDKTNNIFWLTGSYYMRRKIIESIQNSINNFSFSVYDETTNCDFLESQITETSLFEDKKIIILRGFPEFSKTSATNNKKIIDLFEKCPESCFIIIDNVSTAKKTIYSVIQKLGKIYDFPQYLKRNDAINWLSNRFSEKNKQIESSDLQLIVESIGSDSNGIDVDKLWICKEKICDYVGGHSKITRDDIIQSADKYNNFIIWSLFDAMDERDFNKCLSIVNSACQSDKIDNIVNQIFTVVLWRYRMLWFAKESLAKNKTSKNIIEDVQNNLNKLCRKGNNDQTYFELEIKDGLIKPSYSYSVLNNAINGFYGKPSTTSRYKRNEIYRIIKCAEECLLIIRYGASDFEMLTLLDNLFMTLIPNNITYEELDSYRRLNCV